MGWLSLELHLPASEVDAWSDALLAEGAISVDLSDADADSSLERPVFDEPGEAGPAAWPHNVLRALFPETADLNALLEELERDLPPAPRRSILRVAEQDWVRATQAQFPPIRVSDRLYVVPSWEIAPDPQAVNLVVDPGLAFGTGSHPTTRLCLQWLDTHIEGGERLIDYGCGSGILAIAAAKLGAGRVVGVDIDPQAVAASRENARRNGVEASFRQADETLLDLADCLVANILANPLRVLAPALSRHVRPGGRIVLSGILADQAQEVKDAYAPWFNIAVWRQEEDWVALAGTRRDEP
jgi:ribosomal protein L11 methyltransferase